MVFPQDQQEKIISLLKKDASRRVYQREYMHRYREQLREKGLKQKQYPKEIDKEKHKIYYKRKTTIEDIKFLFE